MRWLILLFLALPQFAFALYAPPDLEDLIGYSDLILLGEITDVKQSTFVLRIEEVLAGDFQAPQIEIKKFKDWTCSRRWTAYSVGQREIVFLEKNSNQQNAKKLDQYVLRSAGSESEWPVDNELAYTHGYGLWEGSRDVSYGTMHAPAVKQSEVLSAIRDYRKCFKMAKMKPNSGRVDKIEVICSPEALSRYESSSEFHKVLSEMTKNQSITQRGTRTHNLKVSK